MVVDDGRLPHATLLEEVQGTQASTTFYRRDTTVIVKMFHELFLPCNYLSIDLCECCEPVFPFTLEVLRYSQTRPKCIFGAHIF